MRVATSLALVALALSAMAPGLAAAEDAAAPPARDLTLALNAAEPVAEGCRLSFVVTNGMDAEIEDLSLEIAVFGADGGLTRMLRLGFGVLLDGKTRVRQFDLAGTPCEGIGSVLVNDVAACVGTGLEPIDCLRAMRVSSANGVPFRL